MVNNKDKQVSYEILAGYCRTDSSPQKERKMTSNFDEQTNTKVKLNRCT